MMTNIGFQPAVDEIASVLEPFSSEIRCQVKWTEILKSLGEHAGLGELRDPINWRSVPLDQSLRIVYLVDELGPVVRWLLPEDRKATSLLGGMFHDNIERRDGCGKARSGWLKMSHEGVLVSS